jgi:asparagine synthase (glutamine-hydrolysing)
MCGILASISAVPVPPERFQSALDLLAHRGPDGEGVWADAGIQIGHRRLAIIDLSTQAAQPMHDANTGAVISYNGEIYNYIELRETLKARGHVFRTQSDTEVLLKAWAEWRDGMTTHLNGMWGFVIWEPATRTLFISRDRFGVKPLYYAQVHDRLLIASEPKALLALEPSLAEVNLTALYDLFISSRGILGAQTFFRNIAAVPPGHSISCTVDASGAPQALKMTRYWSYPDPEDVYISAQQSAETFAGLLEDAVALRMRSDVPVGLTLSGGLDSSAILAAVSAHQSGKMHCFTSVYSATERGEEHWAQQAAAVHQHPLAAIEAGEVNWLDTLRSIVWHMDGPSQSSAVFPLWTVAKAARQKGVPVLLEGQGADELLGGYAQYMPFQSRHLLKDIAFGRANMKDLLSHWQGATSTFGQRWSALWHLRAVAEPTYKSLQRVFGRGRLFATDSMPSRGYDMDIPATARRRGGLYQKLLTDHMRDALPSLLHYGDAVTMAHGIESRLPFMDYRMVEWVFRYQPPVISEGRTKWPIRSYLENQGYGAIARRADKLGYPTPVVQWIQGSEAFIREDMLARANARLWSIFDRKAVTRAFEASLKGDMAAAFHFYKIIPTHLWLEQLPAAPQEPAHGL